VIDAGSAAKGKVSAAGGVMGNTLLRSQAREPAGNLGFTLRKLPETIGSPLGDTVPYNE
jgi:hypothetical protein